MKPRQKSFEPACKAGKTYCNPATKQHQSQKKRKTTISPVRKNRQSSPQLHTQKGPEEQVKKHSFAATGVFEESWSSSDYGSSSASIFSAMVTPGQSVKADKQNISSGQGVQQDTVLSKYIERFRHGRPQSREERQYMASAFEEKPGTFWWMSSSSHSSAPTQTTVQEVIQPLKDDYRPLTSSPVHSQRDRSLSPCRGSQSMFSDISSGGSDDTEILNLQEKADRLLLRDDYTMNDGSVHVSPEGLGCSDSSFPLTVNEPLQRPLITDVMTSANEKDSSGSMHAVTAPKSSPIPSLVLPTHPQEDILFQWRLRRKMEQARDSSKQYSGPHGATFSWQSPSLIQTSAEGKGHKGRNQPPEFQEKTIQPQNSAPVQETKNAPGSCTSSSAPVPNYVVSGVQASQPQTIAQFPAHMHFLCDILPCRNHSSTEKNILHGMEEIPTNVVNEKAQVTGNLIETASKAPICGHVPVHSKAIFEPIKGEKTCQHRGTERKKKEKSEIKELEKEEVKVPISCRKQKKPIRSPHQSDSCIVDHAPPPSPIHSALGQVVSEVLFPTKDSSPKQRTPVSSASPHTFLTSQSSVLTGSHQPSMEVISQLLQEAEDSDGKEYEDDPLLNVLRKQRKLVKGQIREVDSVMLDLKDKQQDARPLATQT